MRRLQIDFFSLEDIRIYVDDTRIENVVKILDYDRAWKGDKIRHRRGLFTTMEEKGRYKSKNVTNLSKKTWNISMKTVIWHGIVM